MTNQELLKRQLVQGLTDLILRAGADPNCLWRCTLCRRQCTFAINATLTQVRSACCHADVAPIVGSQGDAPGPGEWGLVH